MPPPTATPLVSGNPLPVALQGLNIALAEIADRIQKLTDLHKKQTTATEAAGKASGAALLGLNNLTGGIGTLRNVTGLALNAISQLTGAITANIASFVALYSPVDVLKLTFAVRDLNAAIGAALVPLLERMVLVVRGIGDTIASLSPTARTMVAALAAAGVGMVVLTIAAEALAAAVASATGGISLIVGAVVGGLGAVALVSKDLGSVRQAVASVSIVARQFLEILGSAFGRVIAAVQPVINLVGGFAAQLAGPFLTVVEQIGNVITGVVAGLIPVITALLPAAASTLQAVWGLAGGLWGLVGVALKPVLAVLQVLAPVFAAIGAPIRLFVAALGAVAQVAAAVLGPAIQLLLFPLKILADVFSAVAKVVEGAFGELGDAFREVGELAAEIGSALSELMGEVLHELEPLFAELKYFARDVIREFTTELRELARWIKNVVAAVRDFLGLQPRVRVNPGGASEGLAIRNVEKGSLESVISKAQQSAFAAGRPVEENYPKATVSVLGKIEEKLGKLPGEFATALAIEMKKHLPGRTPDKDRGLDRFLDPSWLGRQGARMITG